jgi:hypothetical protein
MFPTIPGRQTRLQGIHQLEHRLAGQSRALEADQPECSYDGHSSNWKVFRKELESWQASVWQDRSGPGLRATRDRPDNAFVGLPGVRDRIVFAILPKPIWFTPPQKALLASTRPKAPVPSPPIAVMIFGRFCRLSGSFCQAMIVILLCRGRAVPGATSKACWSLRGLALA